MSQISVIGLGRGGPHGATFAAAMGLSKTSIYTIEECNRHFSAPCGHPLAGIADLSECCRGELLSMNLWAVLLKDHGNACDCRFGCRDYDFNVASMYFLSPLEAVNIDLWRAASSCGSKLLYFHPSLLEGTPLESGINGYSFFRYRQCEALHLSASERATIAECMEGIEAEIRHSPDCYSRTLLTSRIDLLLGYSARFYHRQFITRHDASEAMIKDVEKHVSDYLLAGKAAEGILPDADALAGICGLSPAYFTDMLKHENGKSPEEFVSSLQFSTACDQLRRTGKSIAEIAARLGYPSQQHFVRIFRIIKGCSPREFRLVN